MAEQPGRVPCTQVWAVPQCSFINVCEWTFFALLFFFSFFVPSCPSKNSSCCVLAQLCILSTQSYHQLITLPLNHSRFSVQMVYLFSVGFGVMEVRNSLGCGLGRIWNQEQWLKIIGIAILDLKTVQPPQSINSWSGIFLSQSHQPRQDQPWLNAECKRTWLEQHQAHLKCGVDKLQGSCNVERHAC